jgi:hypothetical protein
VTLQHHLRDPGIRVPELHASILGAAHDPFAVRGKADAEHVILEGFKTKLGQPTRKRIVVSDAGGEKNWTNLVAFKGPNAFPALGSTAWQHPLLRRQLPHLDRLVETAADELVTVRREGHRVDAVFVALAAFEALDQVATGRVPHADTFIERSRGDVASVGGDGDGGDAILDAEYEDLLADVNVPKTDRLVAAAGGDMSAVTREIEGVDVLFVTGKGVTDLPVLDIPNLARLLDTNSVGIYDEHTLINLSSAPVARSLPSGLKHTLRMYRSPSLSTLSS